MVQNGLERRRLESEKPAEGKRRVRLKWDSGVLQDSWFVRTVQQEMWMLSISAITHTKSVLRMCGITQWAIAGNHWVLYVADTVRRIVTYLNPMKTTMGPTELKMIGCIKDLMDSKLKGKQTVKWGDPEEPRHVRQKDSINCGVFTMWYAEQMAKGESLEVEMDPDIMRRRIFMTIAGSCLRRAYLKDESCGVCRNRNDYSEWVMCEQCSQWFHNKCIRLPVRLAKDPTYKFKCGHQI